MVLELYSSMSTVLEYSISGYIGIKFVIMSLTILMPQKFYFAVLKILWYEICPNYVILTNCACFFVLCHSQMGAEAVA